MGHEGKKVLLPILEKSIAHNNVEEFCKTLKLFLQFFFPKSQPILMRVLYRSSYKNNFVKNLKETFTKICY